MCVKGRNCNFGIIPFSKALGRMERLECFFFFLFLSSFFSSSLPFSSCSCFLIIKIRRTRKRAQVTCIHDKTRFC